MSIAAQTLLTQKANKYGASQTSTDFQQRFLDALNYVLDDLENRAMVSTTPVANIGETIDLDAQKYQAVISLGLDVYLGHQFQFGVEDIRVVEARYFDKLKTANMTSLRGKTLSARFGDIDA